MDESTLTAFVLRLAHREDDALQHNVIGVGWSAATGLDTIKDWYAFRDRVGDTHDYGGNLRALGAGAGSLWRFVHDIEVGSLVVVPVAGGFHVGEVSGPVYYDVEHLDDDFAWRRGVRWLTSTA